MSIEIIETHQQTLGENVLLYPLLRQLNVAEIINQQVKSEAEIPLGSVAEILILSRFAKKRIPMYHLSGFCEKSGIDILYDIEAEKLTDDRVGRCLDAMAPDLAELKTTLILRAIKIFDLTVCQIHTDITNILFEGSYQGLGDDQLKVCWGHTKKGQDPRCKQVNFSLSVTADGGVPLWYEAVDGNTSDSVCYTPHLKALEKELGINHPLVIGDSKLVSHGNMLAFCRAGAHFIGPATLDKKEKKRLKTLWKQGGVFSELEYKALHGAPIPYWGLETERTIIDKKRKQRFLIRQIYTFSRQRREVVRHTRAKAFLKAKAALHKIIRCLNKYDYKTQQVIHSRLQSQVIKKCRYYQIQLNEDKESRFSISYAIDWQLMREDEMFDGIYLLRTNLKKDTFSMSAVLCSYKEQPQIERCFSTMKQPPIQVSPLWLHLPQRIESLLFIVFIALLIVMLLQREGRKKVAKKQIPLRVGGRDDLPLTAKVLLAAFDSIAIVSVTFIENGSLRTEKKCTRLSPAQMQVLLALGFEPPSQYWVKSTI